jgi:aspartyl-tRNA(Asn)/glutamyl-tRNA(Gln) amidotransferase subunit A
MHDDSLAFMPATDLAAAIRIRRLSPVEVTRAALDRINRAQPVLNAFLLSPEMPPWRGYARPKRQ